MDKGSSEYRVMSFYSKRARGMMASFIMRNQLKDIDSLKEFNADGYYFDESQSKPNILVFLNDR